MERPEAGGATTGESPAGARLRVGHLVRAVFPNHGYGGMERAAAALTAHLLDGGVDVTLFTRAWPPRRFEWRANSFAVDLPAAHPAGTHPAAAPRPLAPGSAGRSDAAPPRFSVVGVPYTVLPLRPNTIPARLTNYPLFVERMGREVERRARAGALDVVYAQGLCAYGLRQAGRRQGPRGRVPLVMNPQGLEEFKVRHPLKRLAYAPFRAMYARGAQAADRVIATDRALQGEVARFLRVPPERVVVLPNGVDPAAGAALVAPARMAALRARYGLTPDSFIGISVGRLEANKGLPYLLRALARLDRARPWRWLLVGTGGERAALEALAGTLGLQDRVVFTGAVDEADLHNLYALAGAFATATLYEGSSLVALEAMAHALPVAATTAGGLPDKVIPGQTGLLVPPGDAPALAAALATLIANPAAARAMGAAGAALVQAQFTWAAIAAATVRLFEELVPSSK